MNQNDELSRIAKNVNGLKNHAIEIVKVSALVMKDILGVSILDEKETWLRLGYCGREFLMTCHWKIADNATGYVAGIVEWSEIVRSVDKSITTEKFHEVVFDIRGNVDKSRLPRECGQLTYEVILKRVSENGAPHPFEEVSIS